MDGLILHGGTPNPTFIMPAHNVVVPTQVYSVNTPADDIDNGLLAQSGSLANIYVAQNETFTVTVTVKGTATATGETIEIGGTGVTVESVSVTGTGLAVSGTDAVVTGTAVDATITFVIDNTGTANIADLAVTVNA